LTSEQKMVRLMARDFAKRELEPYACERDKNEIFPAEVIRKMGKLGLMGMMIPPEYGGSGAGTVSYSLALQEIAYACASTAVTMSVANLFFISVTKNRKKSTCYPLPPGKSSAPLRLLNQMPVLTQAA